MAIRFFDLYNEWRSDKRLPSSGLCCSLPPHLKHSEAWQFIHPDFEEKDILNKEGFEPVYWASGLKADHKDEEYGFTPLRQTIILLCAALNGEFD